MTTTQTSQARREYASASYSLNAAEDLLRHLATNPLVGNCYYDDALANATILANEMERNLQDVMDRFTPEECGL